ncbi:tautomerase PptA, partial [Citrobacter freundii]|nr:tautomerase PptA [Citrobacter freundii]
MPHVDIKCFPRDLNEEEKDALAADITEVIIRHLQSKGSSVSVALNEIEPEAWQSVEDKFNCYGIPVVKGPVLG